MLHPLMQIAGALRSTLSRSPPRPRCVKKTNAATRLAPLGGTGPKSVPASLSSHPFPQSIPGVIERATKGQTTNGQESKTTSPAARACPTLKTDGLVILQRTGHTEPRFATGPRRGDVFAARRTSTLMSMAQASPEAASSCRRPFCEVNRRSPDAGGRMLRI